MKSKEPLKPADEAIDERLARIIAQVRTHAGRQLEFPWLGK